MKKIQNLEIMFKEDIANKRESLEQTIKLIHTQNQLEYDKWISISKKNKEISERKIEDELIQKFKTCSKKKGSLFFEQAEMILNEE